MAGKGPMRLGVTVGESGSAPPRREEATAGLFLLQAEEAPSVAVVERAKRAAEWGEATVRALDVGDAGAVRAALDGAHACLSTVPYFMNELATDAAIAAALVLGLVGAGAVLYLGTLAALGLRPRQFVRRTGDS